MVKIALVEDDPTIAEMYHLKFTAEGFEIISSADGESGLASIKRTLPQVVLLDVILPKMDGFAVLAELKKDPQTKNIPVLLLTNLGQKADIEKGKQLGAIDYVVKASLTPTQVVEKIKQYIPKS